MKGSGSQLVLERDGKRYLIDVQSQTIRELAPNSLASAQTQAPLPQSSTTTAQTTPAVKPEEKKERETYYTEDIVLGNLPTAYHLPKKALLIDFTHRFAFNEAFEPGAISNLLGYGWLLHFFFWVHLWNYEPMVCRHLPNSNDFRQDPPAFHRSSAHDGGCRASAVQHDPCGR